MGSKRPCLCGTVIRTNLYAGHAVSLIVPEAVIGIPDNEPPAVAEWIHRLHRASRVLARCATCGTLSIVDDDGTIEFFAPVSVARD